MASETGPSARANQVVLPASGFILLAGLTFFWGANWPAMKIALDEIPVWTFRTICLFAGGGGLLLLAKLSGQRLRVPRAEIRPLLLCALFNIIGWHLFSGYGVSNMEAGRASIIAFTMPLWAALLGRPVLGEPLTARKLVGLALGMAGLALLIGPDIGIVGRFPIGAACMLGAAMTWGTGTVMVKRYAWSLSTTVLVGWQLLAGAVPVTIGMFLIEGTPDLGGVSSAALLATLYCIALPMLFCHWAYFKVVRIFPASIAAIGTLAIPVVGVISSALVLGEAIGLAEIAALALVCSALAVVLLRPAAAAPAGAD